MAQDGGDDRLHLVFRGDVEPLERRLGVVVRRVRDEIAPELPDEERRMIGMRDAEAARVLPGEPAAVTEDGFRARVVVLRVVAEVHRSAGLAPAVAEAGQRARL